MYDTLADVGTELLSVVMYALGTLALSAFGLFAEYNSYQRLLGGETLLAGWFAMMGVVALVIAWNLGRDKLLPHLAGAPDA